MENRANFLLISKLFRLACIIIVILCFVFMFLPAITVISDNVSKTYSSTYSFMFKGVITTENYSRKARGISSEALSAFIIFSLTALTLLASVVFNNKNNLPQWLAFVSAVLATIASIVMLTTHKSVSNVLADTLIDGHSSAVSTTIFNNSIIEFGIWGPALFGFLISLLLLLSLIFDGTFKKITTKFGVK